MANQMTEAIKASEKVQEKSNEVLDKLMAVAQADKAFGAPVVAGEYTVITAAEVTTGLGFGFGVGAGSDKQPDEEPEEESANGGGGGGGGGGGSGSRPVAVISIGPNGVEIQPIVDVTKIGLAFLTAIGSMLVMRGRMNK